MIIKNCNARRWRRRVRRKRRRRRRFGFLGVEI
jgi:hypothetical protein